MARDKKVNNRKAAAMADKRRPMKRKSSPLGLDQLEWVDYKDVNLLRRFMSERAKIRARRVSGNTAQQQREIARAIRVAREMALLPYSVRQVTQRSKGGSRRDRSENRDELREETLAAEETSYEAEVDAAIESEEAPVEVEAEVTEEMDA